MSDLPPDPVNDATLAWLLEPEDPGVRYATLRFLLDRPDADAGVAAARAVINTLPPVADILARQEDTGGWGPPQRFYSGKYRSTVWTLLVLAELWADGADARIRAATDFILDHSWHRAGGGFAMRGGDGGGEANAVIPCLAGNMTWALIRLGRHEDPRVRVAVEWLCRHLRCDDGDGPAPAGWPYEVFQSCYGRHSCHMGVVKTLKALAEIPGPERSPEVCEAIARGAEFLLIHHIFRRSHALDEVSRPKWKNFGFPLMYQTDVLEILNLLLDLGYRDGRMNEALDLVMRKRTADGRWLLENSYNHALLVKIERKGAPGKWVTLNALRALKRCARVAEMAPA